MRKYETVFISDPDLSDQARNDLYDKVRNIIANEKGILLNFDEWGNKKLAYEIKKKFRGYYVCATYGGNGDLVKELERNFRLTDDVMKFMTIVLSEDTPSEQFEKEALDTGSQEEPEESTAADDEAADQTVEADADDTADAADTAESVEQDTAVEDSTEKIEEK